MRSSFPIALSAAGISVLDCEHKTPSPAQDGYPYIAIPDIQDGRVVLETTRKISEEDFRIWTRRSEPQAGDIIVTRRGRVGDTAPVPSDFKCAIGQNLVLLRSDGTHVDQGYLRWATRSAEWWSEVDRLTNVGAVFNSLNVRDIGQIFLTFPDLAQQRKIAGILDTLDDKILANAKLAATADELATVIASKATNDGPLTPLANLAEIIMGSSPKGETLNDSQNGIVFYQGVRDFGIRYPSRRVWTTNPIRTAENLDTLLSVRAPVGKVNLAAEKVCVGRGVAALRSKFNAPYMLFHAIRNAPIWTQYNAEGTVFGSINRKQLESALVKWVEPHALPAHEIELASLENVIRAAINSSKTLKATRDAILPHLISGRMLVDDVQKVVESVG